LNTLLKRVSLGFCFTPSGKSDSALRCDVLPLALQRENLAGVAPHTLHLGFILAPYSKFG